MTTTSWPDALQPARPERVQTLLGEFWTSLHELSELIARDQLLLAATQTCALRMTVIELMLAANGIAYPTGTRHLNRYLGESQRAALHKTLIVTESGRNAWIGCAVALLVIYRWYAPQLVERYALSYPQALEDATLAAIAARLPEWPVQITTDAAGENAPSPDGG